jgi:hypothetical protein
MFDDLRENKPVTSFLPKPEPKDTKADGERQESEIVAFYKKQRENRKNN